MRSGRRWPRGNMALVGLPESKTIQDFCNYCLALINSGLRLENVKLFSRQDKILYILDITILTLY